jgi:hypothetical protein
MPLKLKIRFIGLCTFVQRGQITHVLLPPTTAHAHGAHGGGAHGSGAAPKVPAHEARLFFGWPDPERKVFPTPWSIPLGRTILRIRDTGRAKGAPKLPKDIFDISALTGATVDPAALAPVPGAGDVLGRIELDVHGTVNAFARSNYKIPGVGTAKATKVARRTFTVWTETVDEGDLEVEIVQLDAPGGPQVLRLVVPSDNPSDPNDDAVVALAIYHVPVDEMPPAKGQAATVGTAVDHFAVYYDLLSAPAVRPIPVFEGVADSAPVLGGETGVCPNSLAR